MESVERVTGAPEVGVSVKEGRARFCRWAQAPSSVGTGRFEGRGKVGGGGLWDAGGGCFVLDVGFSGRLKGLDLCSLSLCAEAEARL